MKKVLIISGSLPPIRCGVGYYASRLARELAAAKLDFNLLSTKGVHEQNPVPLLSVPNWRISTLPKMLARIKQSQAQIIHIQYPAVGYRRQLGINLLPLAIRLLRPRLKLIISLHEYHQSRWIGRLRNRITIFPAHRVIVSNQSDVMALSSLSHKLLVIPIGANFEKAPRRPEFFKKIMASQKLNPAGKTLVFFGYAFEAKKLEILLDALNEPSLQAYQLLIFPSLDDKSAYHRMLNVKIGALNTTRPRVGTSGFLEGEEASAILQECQYFILPNAQPLSAKSGTAIAAVQNGLVLISRGSPRSEATAPFVHLKNCYLLDEVSPESIAAAIKHLEKSPDEVGAIRRGALELEKYFSWSNIVNQHLKVYEEL